MIQAKDIMDDALATAMHAMRTVVATSLGSTPGALAFGLSLIGKQSRTRENRKLMRICAVSMRSVDLTTTNKDKKY